MMKDRIDFSISHNTDQHLLMSQTEFDLSSRVGTISLTSWDFMSMLKKQSIYILVSDRIFLIVLRQ